MHKGVDYIQPGPKEMDVKIPLYLIRQSEMSPKKSRRKSPRRKHTKLTQLQKVKRLFKPTDSTLLQYFQFTKVQLEY